MQTIIFIIISVMLIPTAMYAENGEDFTELLGIHLGRNTTLADVQNKLGKTRLIEIDTAGEKNAYICYYVPRCRLKVEFWSEDLGGPEHGLIGFTLTRSQHSPPMCSEMTRTDCSTLSISNKIRLGMSLDEYKNALGGNVVSRGGSYQKAFERHEALTEDERREIPRADFRDTFICIRGAFQGNSLDEVVVSKEVTY